MKRRKKKSYLTGAFEDVSLSIENEKFDLESCVPLKTIKREEGLQSEIMELRNKLKRIFWLKRLISIEGAMS
jgi:hypothetical protein